jgi:hypothetical protein
MHHPTRTARATAVAALAASVLAATPALAADGAGEPTWLATLNCGSGSVNVSSGDDIWSPLVALESGRKYRPVAWNLKAGDKVIRERKPGSRKRRTVKCSYADQAAKGTVTVLKRSR